jgi:DNA phosphorothioation-associated putative methyltransferase
MSERGRPPDEDEISNATELISVFGSLRRACRVIFSATDKEQWAEITRKRREDLLIYLALTRFGGRPIFSRLSRPLQGDVRGLLGNYRQACGKADELLYSLGKPGVTDAALKSSKLGKLTPNALYVHESALSDLSPLLRLYEGCAQGYLGKVDGANLIKLHLGEPRVSYLDYPTFETEAHPSLASSMTVQLQTFRVKYRDYRSQQNAPILHRKELFVALDHPMREKFARLTRIEEAKGLYEQTDRIGLQDGWNEALASRGLYLKGHRVLSKTSSR